MKEDSANRKIHGLQATICNIHPRRLDEARSARLHILNNFKDVKVVEDHELRARCPHLIVVLEDLDTGKVEFNGNYPKFKQFVNDLYERS